MKKLLFAISSFMLLCYGQSLNAQAFTFTTGQLTYNETFDGMGSAGTSYLPGWTAVRYAGTGTLGADLTMVVTEGSATSGNVYNVGATGATERAFGTLASGTTSPRMGASFLNNTGASIIQLDLAGTMEQWRSGSNATVNEVVAFEYSLDATDLQTGTWIPVTSFDLLEKITTSTVAAALDGNLPANQTAISASIPGLTWFQGSKLWIRWSDVNDAGSDGLYAIDNLTIAATIGSVTIFPEPTNYPTVFKATAASLSITLSWVDATGTQLPGSYLIKASAADNITAPVDGTPISDDLDLSDGTGAKNVAQGIQSYTFNNLTTGVYYYFKIYPYTNSGTAINYKNDGTAPSAGKLTDYLILHQTFNNGLAPWTQYSVLGDSTWVIDQTHGVSGSPCAKMSGYAGGAGFTNEDWLISPSMNFSNIGFQKLAFQTAMKYGTGDNTLRVLISTDFAGGNPSSNGTWTDLTPQATLSPGNYAWTLSGNIDISAHQGNAVHVAFKYTSTDVGADTRTWEVDEVLVTGTLAVGISENNNIGHNLSMFPNPGNGKVMVKLPGEGTYNLRVYSQVGKLIYSTSMSGTSGQLDLSYLPKGMYILNSTNKITQEQSSTKLVLN